MGFVVMPNWLGRHDWGFGITHFSREKMLAAAGEVLRQNPKVHTMVQPELAVFVVAEDAQQLFSHAHSCLWVVATLLIIGFMQRLEALLSSGTKMTVRGHDYQLLSR